MLRSIVWYDLLEFLNLNIRVQVMKDEKKTGMRLRQTEPVVICDTDIL